MSNNITTKLLLFIYFLICFGKNVKIIIVNLLKFKTKKFQVHHLPRPLVSTLREFRRLISFQKHTLYEGIITIFVRYKMYDKISCLGEKRMSYKQSVGGSRGFKHFDTR
jgi:hypothetical protein